MEPEVSFLCSQVHILGPCPEPAEDAVCTKPKDHSFRLSATPYSMYRMITNDVSGCIHLFLRK